MGDVVDRAREVAEESLFPGAIDTDRSHLVPQAHLDALASAGLYGVIGAPEDGGAGSDFETFLDVIDVLAGGCLSTCFVWIQHHGVVLVFGGRPALRDQLLSLLSRPW